ncbi:nitroreductase [Syntrophotalea acetylenivorans]|uniref:Nitroreductase n=1 Tax=Syntrophotalea acetylenivorans TaxID=1842532 RepID=A0A1L3GQ33_9BACT|nr:SagB/ThcOx family dehydrogenase [Syntrophotalea acetylenivorans]APG28061.1 nitroreductase [Syntrophotalea acetylenivorans]
MEKNSGRDFMEKTKHKNMGVSDQQMHLPQPPLSWPAEPVNPKIELPHPGSLAIEPVDIRLLITQRSSLREYAEKPLALEELSHLLWCTQGVKVAYDQQMTLRTVPSAGARHALETILLVNRVEGLESGLYRYLALDHQLELISTLSNIAGRLAAACFGQRFIMRSAVTFVWIAVPYRMTWRYQERGYRYLHLDAGHVCQNLYLAAEAIDAGVCAVAAFDDDEINTLLCLDPEEAFVIYLAAVGKKMKG